MRQFRPSWTLPITADPGAERFHRPCLDENPRLHAEKAESNRHQKSPTSSTRQFSAPLKSASKKLRANGISHPKSGQNTLAGCRHASGAGARSARGDDFVRADPDLAQWGPPPARTGATLSAYTIPQAALDLPRDLAQPIRRSIGTTRVTAPCARPHTCAQLMQRSTGPTTGQRCCARPTPRRSRCEGRMHASGAGAGLMGTGTRRPGFGQQSHLASLPAQARARHAALASRWTTASPSYDAPVHAGALP